MSHKITPTKRPAPSPVATLDALLKPQYQRMRRAKKREEEEQIAATILKREAHERSKQRVKELQEHELDRNPSRGLIRSPTMSTINPDGEIKIGKFNPPPLYAPIPRRPAPRGPPLGGKKARKTKKRKSIKKERQKRKEQIKIKILLKNV